MYTFQYRKLNFVDLMQVVFALKIIKRPSMHSNNQALVMWCIMPSSTCASENIKNNIK